MDIDFIEKLIDVVARSPIDELELERDGWRVRIAKSIRHPPARHDAPQPAVTASAASSATASAATSAPNRSRHVVKAALTGTFYRSATENGPPAVSVGDVVEEGQILGILEAMKMLNPIDADRAGRVAEILCEDRTPVETGDPLFVLEDAG